MPDFSKEIQQWRSHVLESLINPVGFLDLFEFLPQVYMYVKAADGRYLRVNHVVCRVMGVQCESEVVGKTDFDFFPPAIATQYVDEDRRVIESAQTLRDQVWLVPNSDGVPQIYSCNKIPFFDKQGKVTALAGVKRPFEHSDTIPAGHGRLMKVVRFVTTHYGEEIVVGDLAAEANLSQSQLQREFSRLFGITPSRYLREVRVGVARHLLETTQTPMSQIAIDSGFYDQSHFSKQFKTSTGLTPRQYRQNYSLFDDHESKDE
ncbi:MAG: helix-turn-helix domain-containing protein [Rubripirellula sp.]